MVGKILGHYRVLESIGGGGMGVVYRAYDSRLERDVAIKVLPPGTLNDEAARKRFRTEALALSRFNHPNIATVYDFDTVEGTDFIAMELVKGITLAEKARSGPMGEDDVLAAGLQISQALEEAHEHGVIHRDLKPANVMLTGKGQVKVLDFGLAKQCAAVSDATASASLTQQGVVGTLPYMAPEQLRGEKLDARCDIYALGTVLYETATGRRPFDDQLPTALSDSILHQPPPPPGRINPRISPRLEEIVLKCLEKAPANRYQSAKELSVDLRRLTSSPSITPARAARGAGRRWWYAGGLPLIALLVAAALYPQLRARFSAPVASGKIESLAVLPLENLSRDPDQEYFADGMTEALTTDLSRISALRVISRTSAMHYKGTAKTLPEIGRELRVDAVVEGSVEKSGNRVRITAQLIEAPTDRHLWADSYERDLGDVLALQDDVSRTIAREIRVTLTPQEQTRMTTSRSVKPEAYEAYLRGRFHLAKRSAQEIEQAIASFQKAVDLDPTYAPAYAGLGQSYSTLPWYGAIAPAEAQPKAEAAALKALELDSGLPEGHIALAMIRLQQWDRAGADAELQRAIQLAPGNAEAHYYRGLQYLSPGSRFDEAVVEMTRALDLDPLSLIININLCQVYIYARRYDEAITQCRKTLELDERFARAHSILGAAYEQKGMYKEAISEFRTNVTYNPADSLAVARLGHAYALSGDIAEARKILAELEQRARSGFVPPAELAALHLALGEKEQALRLLEAAYAAHDGWLMALNVEPRFDPLRSEPRFQELVRRMGLRPEDSPGGHAPHPM